MRRWPILVAIAIGLVVGSKLVVEDLLGLSLESAVTEWLAEAGLGSAALIVFLLAADLALPVPSSLIMVLSGAAFGILYGASLAFVGSVAGGLIGFELSRKYGRRVSARIVGDEEERRLRRFFDRHGAAAVILTRPLPIVMEAMSVVAGVSGMSRLTYLVAAAIGTAPVVLVYAIAGAVARDMGSTMPAIVVLVVVAVLGWIWYRVRLMREADPDAAVPARDVS